MSQIKRETKNTIDNFVRKLCSIAQVDTERAVDPYKIAKKLGFKVVFLDDKQLDGYILFDRRSRFDSMKACKVLGVSKNKTSTENREIIADELAHFFVKCAYKKDFYYYQYTKNESDPMVVYFKYALLLPREKIIRKKSILEKKGYSKDDINHEISIYFDVSEHEVNNRILFLGV